MKFHFTIISILFLNITLCAGDAAQFCALGWSPGYKHFAFTQCGEQDGSGFPYAELFIVDVEKNNFVDNGVIKCLWNDEVDTAAKGLHALLALYVDADSVLKACAISIDHQVRPVFIQQDGECTHARWRAGDSVFSLVMQQETKGDPGSYESSAAFSFVLHVDDETPLLIGNNKRFRKYVLRYDIDHIMQAPDNKSVVIVIRITKLGFEGPDIRYMVETIKMP